MTESATISWYQKFWPLVNKWLSEMAAKDIKRVYITNEDSNSWKMVLDEDSDIVCVAR